MNHLLNLNKTKYAKLSYSLFIVASLLFSNFSLFASETVSKQSASVIFKEDAKYTFTEQQREFIQSEVLDSYAEVRDLLPELPNKLSISVEKVDWDLDIVGGVVGRAESNVPPLILIQISKDYKNGNLEAIRMALKSAVFHEVHHIARGWAIQDNHFGPGIPNAMVNEGLAVVFAEIHTGYTKSVNSYEDVTDEWIYEIQSLPLDASYAQWVMGENPDGRTSIGYRAGNYLIRKAMAKSGLSIVELTKFKPAEIIKLAGF